MSHLRREHQVKLRAERLTVHLSDPFLSQRCKDIKRVRAGIAKAAASERADIRRAAYQADAALMNGDGVALYTALHVFAPPLAFLFDYDGKARR